MKRWPEPTGEVVAFVTKHAKERLVGDLVARAGMTLMHIGELDTDALGTFSRSRPRVGSALDAARTKCRWALTYAPRARFALASEGSFGPHPAVPWVARGSELVLLVDRQASLELRGEDITTETNFASTQAHTVEDARAFALNHGFPSHGLLVGRHPGVTRLDALERLVRSELLHGPVHLETDMRASLNPTRQLSIRRAAERCFEALARHCPRCGWPGFVVSSVERGLRCEACATPTNAVAVEIFSCGVCGHRHHRPVDAPKAPAALCDACNP
ncbi:MAG: hypothetical protein JNG84_09270 [Archangium sp.]|nr:hypothetical protein [Archangium sp.]